jgi:Histidine kinase-, DNA gyrase B-, and HSP90-like ATPase
VAKRIARRQHEHDGRSRRSRQQIFRDRRRRSLLDCLNWGADMADTDAHFKVEVDNDHLRKLTTGRPIAAVAELVWNAVDADATRVEAEVDGNDVRMNAVTVRDNGHGIPHGDAGAIFARLGGSWKAHARSQGEQRFLHGKEGKGRFKALALGRVADWIVTYREGTRTLRYTIALIRDDLVDVRVSLPVEVDPSSLTGVEVRITELDRTYRSLLPDQAVQPLSEIFALYLTDYPAVAIYVDHERLDPSKLIRSKATFDLEAVTDEGNTYPAKLELIEWIAAQERSFFLCGEEGFPLHRIVPLFHAPGAQFSAYLKSPLVADLQTRGVLELAQMNGSVERAYAEASEKIKNYFRDRSAEAARSEIEEWKAEKVYPYRDEPKTPVETAERQVFDIVALNVNKHLADFATAPKQTKAFQLRMPRRVAIDLARSARSA